MATDGIMSLALSWLSQRLRFKYDLTKRTTLFLQTYNIINILFNRYSFLQVNDTKMEPLGADLPGLTYYLVNGVGKYETISYS